MSYMVSNIGECCQPDVSQHNEASAPCKLMHERRTETQGVSADMAAPMFAAIIKSFTRRTESQFLPEGDIR